MKTNTTITKRKQAPFVSVIMPVYNGERFLKQSIESILTQSFEDFEFIIVNDGSTDKTRTIIESYKDSRIRLINQPNKGLSAACNKAISIAKGKYIARQDDDDISLKDRLLRQVEYMNKHPETGLLGTNFEAINENGETINRTNVFTHPSDLKLCLVFANQFGHGTAMIKSSLIKKFDGYNEEYKIAQDYELWSRISRTNKVANLKECLYLWRQIGKGLSTSADNSQRILKEGNSIREREFKYYRSHKNKYRHLSFHPFSTKAGLVKYLEKKNTLYRNMSLRYCYIGRRRFAIPFLLLAILFAPWVSKSYLQLSAVLKNKSIDSIPYEHI